MTDQQKEEEVKKLLADCNTGLTAYSYEQFRRSIQPASFIMRKPKRVNSNEMVIDLITKSVAESKAITRDDIYMLYWLYKTDYETRELDVTREFINWDWQNVSMNKDQFLNHWRMQRNAVSWFKSALSSAILEGNLLVLPIIKI